MTGTVSIDGVFEDGSRLGIENEWFIHEARSIRYAKNAAELIDASHESFRTQFELQTLPIEASQVEGAIRSMRQKGAQKAADVDGIILATGTCLLDPPEGHLLSDNLRNRRYISVLRGQILSLDISGTHVHVTVNDPDKRVMVANRIRPWLDVLTAICSSSAICNRRVTGYSSWRAQAFKSFNTCALDYPYFPDWKTWVGFVREELEFLGLPADDLTRFHPWGVRPHPVHPTVEVRCMDAGLTAEDDALAAYIVQGLVITALNEINSGKPQQYQPLHSDFYRKSLHNASYGYLLYGPEKRLMHPLTLKSVGAAEVIADLLAYIDPALKEVGTRERTSDLIEQILYFGSGSDRIISACNALNVRYGFDEIDTWFTDGAGFFPFESALNSQVVDDLVGWVAKQTVDGSIADVLDIDAFKSYEAAGV